MKQTEIKPAQKVYVCGKITGLSPQEVEQNFVRCATVVWKSGFRPVNPVEIVNNPEANWAEAMGLVVPALLKCQGIYVQQNWKSSKGSIIEIMLAHAAGHFFLFENHRDIPMVMQLKPEL